MSELAATTYDQDPATAWQPELAFWAGDWEQAEALWTQAFELHKSAGNRYGQAGFACWLARLLHVRGDTQGAEALLLEALAVAVDGPIVPIEMSARANLSLLAVDADHPQDARPHLARCRQIQGQGEDWRGLAGRVALAEAAVSGNSGAIERARPSFERAISIFRRYGLPWDEAETLIWWGRVLLTGGDRAGAIAKLDAALELYRNHDAGTLWIEYVLSFRRSAIEQTSGALTPDRSSPPTYPDGLTPREVEVLRLIAIGRSNAEIAADLVLSIRTVGRHITNLYTKIGARSKVDATNYARRRFPAIGDSK